LHSIGASNACFLDGITYYLSMALLLVFEEHFQSVFFFMHASESILEFLHNKNTQHSFTKVDKSTFGPIIMIVGLIVIG